VPRGALGFIWPVDLRAQVVEQQERDRVDHREAARDGAADGEAGTLRLAMRGDDLCHRSRPRPGRIGERDTGEDERVVDGDSRHCDQLLSGGGPTLMTCPQYPRFDDASTKSYGEGVAKPRWLDERQ